MFANVPEGSGGAQKGAGPAWIAVTSGRRASLQTVAAYPLTLPLALTLTLTQPYPSNPSRKPLGLTLQP